MKYAIVKIGGSQYRVAEGDQLDVEKIEGQKSKKITFSEVLLLVEGEAVKIGQPYLKGAEVKAEIVGQFKGKKIRVATYKAKSRYRRVIGHRKLLTKIIIKKISQTIEKKPKKESSVKPLKAKASAK
ncbi:50S ribosomal protein L21 [Patescibacteria group bacterium]